ncbi:MAG: glycoside hydrolase family 20 zincin-like fold domain-containing protein [Planctomycetota bacterium]
MTITDERQFARLLIPPKKVIFRRGVYRWPRQPVLASPRAADILPLRQLEYDLALQSLRARVVRNAFGPTALRVLRDERIAGPEAYRLVVATDAIEIYAAADAGAYYALQTLRDLTVMYGRALPVCRIEDRPDFRRRGVYHDCSRGKVPTLDTLKDLVTRLAHWKINELQLYIENVFTFKQHPEIGRGYSPFTAAEILRLQDHCRMHHVRLVGSLASSRYLHLDEMPGFRGFAGGTTLCPSDPGSIRLIGELYREFMPLFEADDFNVCCDETWELGRGRSKRRAARIGVGRVYLNFLLKIHRLCEKHGKRMNAWADIVLKYPKLLADLPRDIVLLNWEYEHNGANIARTKEIARAGFNLMVCPGTSSWLTHGSRLGNSVENVTKFASEGRRRHAEGLLNTDWGDQGHRNFLGVSLHGFAHGAAHAWRGKGVDNARFTENFCYHVFGQRTSGMAEALQSLGNTYITCGCPCRNESLLYHALVEPLLHIRPPERSPIDMMDETGLQKILSQLSARTLWPKPEKPMARFERLALRELKLAARMDCLASRRALTAKALRAGKVVRSTELRRLSSQMHDMAEDFKKLWLARNKVSRLRDNCKLFRRAEQESRRLASRSAAKGRQ